MLLCKAHQDVDVATSVEAVWKPLPRAAKEEARDAFLDVLEAEDGRSNRPETQEVDRDMLQQEPSQLVATNNDRNRPRV